MMVASILAMKDQNIETKRHFAFTCKLNDNHLCRCSEH